jgi:acyl carrier protein
MNKEIDIIEAIAEQLGVSAEDVDRGASLRDDLGLGPIEINDLLNNLSQRFEITIEPDQVEELQTVEDLIVLVEDNLIE